MKIIILFLLCTISVVATEPITFVGKCSDNYKKVSISMIDADQIDSWDSFLFTDCSDSSFFGAIKSEISSDLETAILEADSASFDYKIDQQNNAQFEIKFISNSVPFAKLNKEYKDDFAILTEIKETTTYCIGGVESDKNKIVTTYSTYNNSILFSNIPANVTQIKIYDLRGHKIRDIKFENKTDFNLDINNYQRGYYIIQFFGDKLIEQSLFLKK